jgi:hypothetical protein
MNVFVPFTEIQPETKECLAPYDYTPVEMVNDDDYLHYFQQRWNEKESFINCEHDTIFERGAIEELENCSEEWCAFGVWGNEIVWDQESSKATTKHFHEKHFVDGNVATLALMKFGQKFIAAHPAIWDEMAASKFIDIPMWRWCDLWLDNYTQENCHQHYPRVINANPLYPSSEELEDIARRNEMVLEEEGTVGIDTGAAAGVHMPTVMVENNILDKNGKRIKKESEELEK